MLVKNGGEACNASLDFFEGIKISEIAHIGDIFIYPSDSLINFVLPPTPSIGKNKRDSAQIRGQVPTLISLETLKGALIYRNRATFVGPVYKREINGLPSPYSSTVVCLHVSVPKIWCEIVLVLL